MNTTAFGRVLVMLVTGSTLRYGGGNNLTWICRTRPNGTYFKSNYGRSAPLGISTVTEATALSFYLFHSNAVEKYNCGFSPLSYLKLRVIRFNFGRWIEKSVKL
jgi:hypothetical protein